MRTSTRAIIISVLMAIVSMTFSINAAVVGLWRLNEGTGDSVHDESGNNNHAKITGPAWTTGFHSGALEYDGIDDSVRVPHSVSLASPVSAITMEAWFYAYAFNNNEFSHIINKFGVYVLSVRNHVPAIALRVGSHVWWTPDIDSVPLNQWVYYAATYDGLKKRIFINGNMVAEGDLTGTINEGAYSDPVEIGGGRLPSENSLFNGKIDEVCISNHAMTPAEILERYYTFIGPLPQLIPVPSPTYNRRPVFKWKPVSGATTYKIEIDTISSFTSSIVSIELADTQFVPLTDLAEKLYYWHVSCNKNPALFSPTDSVQVDYGISNITNQKNSVTMPRMSVYPNPFKGAVTINCTVPLHTNARLLIYRIDGTLIKQFNVTAGQKESRITWDGRDKDNKKVANGMYVIKLKSGTMNLVKRIISID